MRNSLVRFGKRTDPTDNAVFLGKKTNNEYEIVLLITELVMTNFLFAAYNYFTLVRYIEFHRLTRRYRLNQFKFTLCFLKFDDFWKIKIKLFRVACVFNIPHLSTKYYGFNTPPSGIIITTQQTDPSISAASVKISLGTPPTCNIPKKSNRLFAPIVALSAKPSSRTPPEMKFMTRYEAHPEASLPCTSGYITKTQLSGRTIEMERVNILY
uniref:Ion_trans domain-containing protein n=1 Tax=Heterorhabditis bacteriophora TaxID=37862 RepID=A0A1I7WUC1_HETBA